jgi:UDP-3-O-[3-hydroxymyristoyl] glucosamine N-acyltransferase
MTIREIAEWLGGEAVGSETLLAAPILRVAKIEEADPGCLTFLANPKYQRFIATTRASAVLVVRSFDAAGVERASPIAFIKVDDPYLAFLHVLKRLTPTVDPFPTAIDATALIAASVKIGKDVAIGPYVVIGEGAVVGDRTRIAAQCVIGPGVTLGSDCLLYPRVSIYQSCRVGGRVVLHSGCVIGSDGFGFAPRPDGSYEKIPQLGIVAIEDDVEIGANSTIDRATIGETRIEQGAKIDNLVQIGHNCVIGAHTVIAAQTGVSGSCKIGKHCMIGGQVGFAGHLEVADRTTIMAQSGIPKSITEPGKAYFGYPATEARLAQRMMAAVKMLPETMRDLQALRRAVSALEERIAGTTNKS